MSIQTKLNTSNILGQPSWELASNTTQLAVTRLGGQMAPVRFKLGSRVIEPYSVAPWAEEIEGKAESGKAGKRKQIGPTTDPEMPAVLRALRGDFFCAPFGGNETPYRGERHPPHGESANAEWTFQSIEKSGDRSTLHLALETKIRPGTVDKFLQLRDNESIIYSRHTLSGMQGPMTLGHHAMLKFPPHEGSGHLSTSPVSYAQVAPRPFEIPSQRGYQSLLTGAMFKRLDRVSSALGGHADLSRYPARRGYEDLVMLVHSSRPDFAWTAVAFPEERYVWFSLKNPTVLRSTIFWITNGGRHYAPWNGRHVDVMGIEDVTSYFHYGIAESARPNPVNKLGYATALALKKNAPLTVSYIMGVAEVPSGFEKVKSIVPGPGHVILTSTAGHRIKVSVDTGFLKDLP